VRLHLAEAGMMTALVAQSGLPLQAVVAACGMSTENVGSVPEMNDRWRDRRILFLAVVATMMASSGTAMASSGTEWAATTNIRFSGI